MISTQAPELNSFFGEPGSQSSLKIKKQYGRQISDTITKSVIGKSDNKPGLININGLDFDIYSGLDKKIIAEQKVNEINSILKSPVGFYLKENTKMLLTSVMNEIKNDLKELGDEYDNYHTMNRTTFLEGTESITTLEETIKALSGDNLKTDELSENLLFIAKKRLKKIS